MRPPPPPPPPMYLHFWSGNPFGQSGSGPPPREKGPALSLGSKEATIHELKTPADVWSLHGEMEQQHQACFLPQRWGMETHTHTVLLKFRSDRDGPSQGGDTAVFTRTESERWTRPDTPPPRTKPTGLVRHLNCLNSEGRSTNSYTH